MKSMRKQYGSEEGKKVFYASKNKGTIKGVEEGRVDEVAPLIAGVARGLAKVGSVAAKKIAPVAKKAAKKVVVKTAKTAAERVRDKSQDEMEENTMKNAYVKKLMESKPSREVVETPGGKMTVARSKITGGQYQKAHGDTEGSKKSGREAAKMISQARSERLARQGLDETRSAESRARTKGRKEFGTPGREGKLSKKTSSEIVARGLGQSAAKDIGRAKTRETAAKDIDTHHKVGSGPKASKALRSHASQLRKSADEKIERGKQEVSAKRSDKKEADAENKAFRRGTMKDHTEYRRIGALVAEAMGLLEMQYMGGSFIPRKGETRDSGLPPKKPGSPAKKTPEAAAAGKKRAEERAAERKKHIAKKSEEARAERAKREAGQTLDPYTGKPKK